MCRRIHAYIMYVSAHIHVYNVHIGAYTRIQCTYRRIYAYIMYISAHTRVYNVHIGEYSVHIGACTRIDLTRPVARHLNTVFSFVFFWLLFCLFFWPSCLQGKD
jgi:hypothetical protein